MTASRVARLTTWQLAQRSFAAAFAVILLALAMLQPTGDGRLRLPLTATPLPAPCATYRETGEPCPSCGLARGMVAALRLDLEQARRFHPAAIPLLLLIAAQVIARPLAARAPLRGPRTLAIGAVDFAVHAWAVGALLTTWASG